MWIHTSLKHASRVQRAGTGLEREVKDDGQEPKEQKPERLLRCLQLTVHGNLRAISKFNVNAYNTHTYIIVWGIKGKATINSLLVRKLMVGHEEEHLDCGDKM